jgi:hypothetical protein
MRALFRPILIGALASSMLAPAAGADPVVDDFETGTFHLVASSGAQASGSYSVASPAHALAGLRQVTLHAFGAGTLPSEAELNAWTRADDELRLTFGPLGGAAMLTYEPPAPVDLTDGGLNDRVEVSISASTVGGTVLVALYDDVGGWGAHGVSASAGANVFDFANTPAVDVTHITKVVVQISHPGASAYDVRDVRAMRANATWLRFAVPTETVVGPPYPLAPLAYAMTNAEPSDIQRLRLMNATGVASGAAAGIAVTGMDSGEGAEPGYTGVAHAAWNEIGRPFESTHFDLRVDISALSGVDPEPFLPALPEITASPTGFLLGFDVHFPGDDAHPARTSRRQLAFDAFANQPLRFENVNVQPAGVLGGEDAAEFRVAFDLEAAGGVDAGEPLFEVTMTGDVRHEATTGVPSPGVPVGAQALIARPTVTRTATELHLARPAEGPAGVAVLDVSGRLVRRLDVPRGASACTWDGRSADGRPVAGGVYLAHFADSRSTARTRIVIVR